MTVVRPQNLEYFPHFLEAEEAKVLGLGLIKSLVLERQSLFLFGREVLQPRLVAFYAETNRISYTYSRRTQLARVFTPELAQLQNKLSAFTGHKYNACLCNLYRDGEDSMGWHSDDEPELSGTIASLSFGATRSLAFRQRGQATTAFKLPLEPGSLLLMSGEIQRRWQHALPKSKKIREPRLNLTFRNIRP